MPVSAICQGLATFSLQTPQPSFATDAELNARFPTEIDGQPVTNVRSSYWLQILCYSGSPQAIQQFAQTLGGSSNLAALSYGTADATVDDESVTIEGLRAPGQDANLMVQQLETFLTALGVDPADIAGRTTAQANVGGKNAWTITEQDGDVTYAYASGDVLFTVSSVSEAQAATIFAALP